MSRESFSAVVIGVNYASVHDVIGVWKKRGVYDQRTGSIVREDIDWDFFVHMYNGEIFVQRDEDIWAANHDMTIVGQGDQRILGWVLSVAEPGETVETELNLLIARVDEFRNAMLRMGFHLDDFYVAMHVIHVEV